MKVSVKVSAELRAEERCRVLVGHRARLRTGGQLRHSLDKTDDLSGVRAGVWVSVAWPEGRSYINVSTC